MTPRPVRRLDMRFPQNHAAIARNIKKLLQLPLEDLYASVAPKEFKVSAKRRGGSLPAGAKKSSASIKYLASHGKSFFDGITCSLYELICVQWKCCEKLTQPRYQDPVVLIATIADIISQAHLGLPCVNIAVLLFKLGLSKFCGCNKKNEACNACSSK